MSQRSHKLGHDETKRIDVEHAWQDSAPRSRFIQRFKRHRLAAVGGVLLSIMILIAVFAPILTPHDPNRVELQQMNKPPSREHWLGTDAVGRDYFTRIIYGARISLSVGVVSASIAAMIGTILGTISGFFGGRIDTLIQRMTELVMSFPSLIVIIALVAFVGPSVFNIMIIFGLLGWTSFCRVVRGQVLSIREYPFVEAAKAIGVPSGTLMFRHVVPNAIPYVIVLGTLATAQFILAEAGLSFLGLGIQAPTPSWGNMLREAQTIDALVARPYRWIAPGVAIAIAVLSINFVGDGLRDALDPRSRLR
jgi:peptide/nickel transport system permease protein